MMRRAVYVDSSAWYAMVDADDPNHALALRRFRRITESRRAMISTNHVIGETYTLMRKRLGFPLAHAFLQHTRTDPLVQRAFVQEAWEEDAERLLAQYDDQAFSYVDATSFATMRRLGIQEALTFDKDFLVAGFTPVTDE